MVLLALDLSSVLMQAHNISFYSTLHSRNMSTFSEFLTEESLEVFTEEERKENVFVHLQLEEGSQIESFPALSIVEDTAMALFIFSLGILLNSIILRCYWTEKHAISIYLKAFAVTDIACLLFMVIRRVCLIIWAGDEKLDIFIDVVTGLTTSMYGFGPLFLAMDRCLIVAFPHNFREHEGKLRVAKGSMVILMALLSVTTAVSVRLNPALIATMVLVGLYFFALFLQILAIIALYTTIVVKILMSDRKMKSSRHIGKK